MKKIDITTDKAIAFSAVALVIFTVVMIVIFCIFQTVPDTLIVSFFGAFGLEGGYCAFIHKVKKDALIAAAKRVKLSDADIPPDDPDGNEDLCVDYDGNDY